MPTLRVVLDTNVLVSGLAYPASIPGRIIGAWRQGTLEVVLSRHILDELTRVLLRLNHRLKWRPVDFADLADILAIEIDLVEPQPLPGDTVRDASDIPVLGTLWRRRPITSSPATMTFWPSQSATQSSPPPSSGSDMVGDGYAQAL